MSEVIVQRNKKTTMASSHFAIKITDNLPDKCRYIPLNILLPYQDSSG